MVVYKSDLIYIESEESEIPWLKIFTNTPYRELSMCDPNTKNSLFTILNIVEKSMLEYYKPTKINIASFGNYLPRVHFHVMARFKEDSFFPEPMWGIKQRESNLKLPPFDEFITKLKDDLSELS
jgi:diadenosine tetraphosphate (Ap4A) HIT family hydrolase